MQHTITIDEHQLKILLEALETAQGYWEEVNVPQQEIDALADVAEIFCRLSTQS